VTGRAHAIKINGGAQTRDSLGNGVSGDVPLTGGASSGGCFTLFGQHVIG
jgi:hypothetical protein